MGNRYQELFNYLASEHDVILVEYEMDEIINICIKISSNELGSENKQNSKEESPRINTRNCFTCRYSTREFDSFCDNCSEINNLYRKK